MVAVRPVLLCQSMNCTVVSVDSAHGQRAGRVLVRVWNVIVADQDDRLRQAMLLALELLEWACDALTSSQPSPEN